MKPELKRNITKKKVLTKVLKEMGNCNMDKFDDNSHIGQKKYVNCTVPTPEDILVHRRHILSINGEIPRLSLSRWSILEEVHLCMCTHDQASPGTFPHEHLVAVPLFIQIPSAVGHRGRSYDLPTI